MRRRCQLLRLSQLQRQVPLLSSSRCRFLLSCRRRPLTTSVRRPKFLIVERSDGPYLVGFVDAPKDTTTDVRTACAPTPGKRSTSQVVTEPRVESPMLEVLSQHVAIGLPLLNLTHPHAAVSVPFATVGQKSLVGA